MKRAKSKSKQVKKNAKASKDLYVNYTMINTETLAEFPEIIQHNIFTMDAEIDSLVKMHNELIDNKQVSVANAVELQIDVKLEAMNSYINGAFDIVRNEVA